MNTSEGENGNKIKNINKNEENHRFSTLLSSKSYISLERQCFYNASRFLFGYA